MIGVRREASFFFFGRNTLSSHRRCIKLNFISTTVSEQAGTLTLSVEEMFFFRKSLYITLKQDHTATQHLYSFYCLLIRKKKCRIVASVTDSFTNLFSLKIVSLRVFTSSFSALRFFEYIL